MKTDRKQSKKINEKQVQAVAEVLRHEGKGEILSDVSGSYTGMPMDGEVPVQDADDL